MVIVTMQKTKLNKNTRHTQTKEQNKNKRNKKKQQNKTKKGEKRRQFLLLIAQACILEERMFIEWWIELEID